MLWWEATLTAMGGVGGAIMVIISAVKWFSGQIAERLQKSSDEKLQEKLDFFKKEIDKELETHKSALGNKNYITQKKFDVEFNMYQALAEKYYKLVSAASILIPSGYVNVPADKAERDKLDKKHYDNLVEAMKEAQDLIYKYGPFIQEKVFDGYQEILKLCQGHKFVYENRWNINDRRSKEEKESFGMDDYKRTDKILELYDNVNKKLREYLQSLEIL